MIKLSEILHTINAANREGLTDIENWKITDVDFLTDIGFEQGDMYHFFLQKPNIIVSHKKGVGFILEDKTKKQTLTFPDFNQLIEYFTKYQQDWENSPYR